MTFRLTVMVLLAALGGCKADTARDEADRRGAEGEVLGGTISDGMVPIEAVTSQSPALRPTAASSAGAGEEGAEASDGEGDAAGEGAAAASPQASPVPLADPAE